MTSRSGLKVLFQAGKKPTEDHFAQLIDAMINQADDNISISAEKVSIGTQQSQKKLDVNGDAIISGALSVGNSEEIKFLDNGKIGIGRSPDKELDVIGELRVSAGLTIGAVLVTNSNNKLDINSGMNIL